MNDDFDLKNFQGVTRLFPLRQLVMFPHVMLPLHIFEPRYRQMTEHALEDDRLITMIQSLGVSGASSGIATVGCLGRIFRNDRLPDGCFNILLLGKTRVQIKKELTVSTLYRQAEVEVLDEIDDQVADPELRDRLIWYFERLHSTSLEPELGKLLRLEMTLGTLCDILAHSAKFSAEIKQSLLEENHVPARCEALLDLMARELRIQKGVEPFRVFPPPFSLN